MTSSRIIPWDAAGPQAIFVTFDTTANRTVKAKVGVSFVSDDNARVNRQTENRG